MAGKIVEIETCISELKHYNKCVQDKCFGRAIKLLKEYKEYIGRWRDDRS